MSTTEIGDASQTPSPRSRRRRLASLRNVRSALADALWALETEQMEPGRARALIYGYSVLAGIIQGSDLEQRIEWLENAARETTDATP
jgi:hypothetical protein